MFFLVYKNIVLQAASIHSKKKRPEKLERLQLFMLQLVWHVNFVRFVIFEAVKQPQNELC